MEPRSHVWRLQGVPLDCSREHLTNILRHHPDLQAGISTDDNNYENGAEVGTLARHHGGRHQVATIRFCRHPKKLVPGKGMQVGLTTSNYYDGQASPSQPPKLTIDDHFHGITTLSSPTAEQHRANILVVPGLGSHPFGSFVNKEDGHMWLCDDLVRDAPGARIMIYGYGSSLQASQSVARLGDLARSLQIPMCELLRSEPRRPLILIAHSLGGLLVKEALIQTFESQSESDLLELVTGCILFGVPNDGMDITSLIPMVNDGPNRLLLQSLEDMNPEVLRMQKRGFSAVLDYAKLELFCFFETELSPTAAKDPITGRYKMNGIRRLLLTQASATSCLTAEMSMERSASLARTHSNLVKFALHDDEYDKVSSQIKWMYASSTKVDHKNRKEILESLYFPEMSHRKRQIHGDVTGSLGWIWANASFRSWLQSRQCLFWIEGKPGSGKSLLLQLVDKIPDKADAVRDIALDGFDPRQEMKWTSQALLQAVKTVVLTARNNICIFVDGLDEYARSYLDLIELFRGIESLAGKSTAIVKICLASRPNAVFLESFKDIGSIRMQNHNRSTIRQYVSAKFRIVLQDHDEMMDVYGLIEQIVENAEGVFLWAQFASQTIIEGIADGESFTDLQHLLLELPSDLEAVYDRMLRRLKPRQFREAYVILSLVSHAFWPLNLQALYTAVGFATGPQDSAELLRGNPELYDPESPRLLSDFARKIRSYTCGLVEVTGNSSDLSDCRVRLIHRTVKAFLDRPQALVFLGGRKGEALIDPEWLWLKICAEELKQHPSGFKNTNVKQLGFYVDNCLFHHAREAEKTGPGSSFTVLDPVLTPDVLKHFDPETHRPDPGCGVNFYTRAPTTPLNLAANMGLVKFCRDTIKAGSDPNENNGGVLQAAMEGLRDDVVQMLLLEHDLDISDCHIIDALGCMHLSTVQAMMMKRVAKRPIELTNRLGQSIKPLYAIARTRMPWDGRAEDIFRYFLQLGEDVNGISGPKGTALHGAIQSAFLIDPRTLIRRLDFILRSGADINAQEPSIPRGTIRPLDLAFKTWSEDNPNPQRPGYMDGLEFLLDRGAESVDLDRIEERMRELRHSEPDIIVMEKMAADLGQIFLGWR